MARYVNDYQDISGHGGPPRGMDPNYRGHYGGMRMSGRYGQAEYGRHRMRHPRDFDGSGGRFGHFDPKVQYSGEYESGYGSYGGGRYDRDWQGGGTRNLRRSPEAMRDFNANSPALRPSGYDREQRGGRGRSDQQFADRHRYRQEFVNRGIGSGGYSEGWAWGPMRGAR